MKKTIAFFCCAMFLAALNLKSQVAYSQKEIQETKSSSEIKKTIQILFLASEKADPIALTADLIKQIEGLRQENNMAYLDVNKGCKIKILPKNMINQPNFKPLEEYIVVEKFETK